MARPGQPIASATYSEEYFLTECDGYEDFLAGGESSLVGRLQALCKFLRLRPGMKVLDIGCGRGEMVVHCGMHGISAVGVDYSEAGLHLAQQAIRRVQDQKPDVWQTLHLSLGNAKALPFLDGTFDRAIMSDVVEHLYPQELETALREVHRVLATDGEVLVHTMPNLWYYRYGYPLFRLVQRLRGVSLPADPRKRLQFSHVHVNEQTPRALRQVLSESGFAYWRVWLYDYRNYSQHGPVMRRAMRLLTGLPLVKQLFCDDIFALARK